MLFKHDESTMHTNIDVNSSWERKGEVRLRTKSKGKESCCPRSSRRSCRQGTRRSRQPAASGARFACGTDSASTTMRLSG
jgi:hypothetical protein